MPVLRISKITKELNVGLSTVVKFLRSKGYHIEENPNVKISKEEYLLLVEAFGKDKYVKLESEKFSNEYFQNYKNIENKKKYNENQLEFGDKHILVNKVDSECQSINFEKKKLDIECDNNNKKKDSENLKYEFINGIKVQNSYTLTEHQQEQENKINYVENKNKSLLKIVENGGLEKHNSIDVEAGEIREDRQKTIVVDHKKEHFTMFDTSRPSINFKITGKVNLNNINYKTRPKRKTKEEKKEEREINTEIQSKIKQHNFRQEIDKKVPSSLSTKNEEKYKKKKRNRIKRKKIDIEHDIVSHAINNKNNFQFKNVVNKEIEEKDIQKKIKETLLKLTGTSLKKGTKYRKEKREINFQRQDEQNKIAYKEKKTIKVTEFVTANDLANMMNVPVNQVISTCMSIDLIVSINQRLDSEIINLVANEFGYQAEYVGVEVMESSNIEEKDRTEDQILRPPIVTIMGHVDHGKTSLLDNIRKSNVIAGESGGITQHIGAYHVQLKDGQKITFLDTPGHEAFTAMRARGTKVTDIVIVVIAADDDVMPQTIEAINHAAAAAVPIIFAINKIDKSGSNPKKIKESLSSINYLVEDFGGKYQSQNISAKKGIGVEELLEKVLLEAELLELKANPNKKATGSVIESSLDKGRGYIATILIQNGTLKKGDVVLAGSTFGRVKAMFNERNQIIKQAGPSEPVLILGLNGAPHSGDKVRVMELEYEAREIAIKREQLQREQEIRTQKLLTLDDIGARIAVGNFRQLSVIVKGDVNGSVEAISDSLINLSTEQIQVKVIHKAIGQISESDVILAVASNAFIIGFQVRPSPSARKLAEKEGVDIRLYSIIYRVIDDVKSAMAGLLTPEIKEEVTATVETIEVFKVAKIGTIAGCMVKEGKISQYDKIHLIRNGVVIYTGELASLKRFKDNVKEVTYGYECGLNIRNFNDIKVGDIVESFREVKIKKII